MLNVWKLMGAREPDRAALVRLSEAMHLAAERKLERDSAECARLQRKAERRARRYRH